MTEGLRLRLYYRLAGALAWLAYRALGLRRSVVRDNLARFYFQSGDNGMPWGKWDPQYQSVGVRKIKSGAVIPTNSL